jgi:hypothetical protein
MREFKGALSEDAKIVAITKIVSCLMEKQCPLDFIGGNY